ncbi:ATP-dependent Zn proteases [Roseomonas mucosa]|uniref:AAA family ATPase n=1 Tax=Roseomonas mucosa TaxID=207340 RepID=UPI0024CB8FDF|nr:AAA family ATPase [Roseomonas mucosa]QDD95123.1 ATP-dependent Zn proteases [Roseomonas mucosa]
MPNPHQDFDESEFEIHVKRLGDEPDSEDPARQVDPARAASLLALRRTLAAHQVDAATLQGAVIIEVPEAAWIEPVSSAWTDVVSVPSSKSSGGRLGDLAVRPGEWMVFEGGGGSQRRQPPIYENDLIATSLWQGQNVLGVSQAPERYLPPDLLRAADLRLVLEPLDAEGLKVVAQWVTNGHPTSLPSRENCALISPLALRLARRSGQSADDFLERAARIAARSKSAAVAPGGSLDSLPGMDEAVAWGLDLARDLQDYAAGRLLWRDVDRGCLLAGPPGTGKTTFAKALAATCGVPLVATSYARWQSTKDGHLGDLLRAMAASFNEARKAAPCIMFIDELDSLHTRQGGAGGRDWWTAVIGALLEQLDGLQGREGVVVVGATNHPELIDPAILRAGRLDRTITIPLPDRQALAAILRIHLGADLAGADLTQAALYAQGSTGADCEKWVRGARRRARNGRRPMVLDDLMVEIRGTSVQRPVGGRVVPAVHEAGHALIQELEQPGTLKYVSIREDALSAGHVAVDTVSDDLTEAWLSMHLRRFLAGRAAEEVVLGHVTGGSGGPINSDLARATWLAVNADTAMGMSRRPLLWLGLWDDQHLATLLLTRPELAQRTEERLAGAYAEVCGLLREHRATLNKLAAELIQREVLTGAEVEAIVRAERQT